MKQTQLNTKIVLLYLQLIVASAAVFGSLYFSEVMKFAPCDLCWYQRLFLYPIVLICLTGFFINSKETSYYIAPFIWFGLAIATYHNLIYYKVIKVIIPCNESSPCTLEHINYFGFITIPFLSIMAFIALLIFNTASLRIERKGNS